MRAVEEKILRDGVIVDNEIIKVDSFLNHQIDLNVLQEFANEVKDQFKNQKIDKILTIETSGIAVAYAVAEAFGNIPLLYAKKSKSKIVSGNLLKTSIKSFTRNEICEITINSKYLPKGTNVLIVDDFLAEGNAGIGLIELCNKAEANVIGVAVVIEKYFQGGHKKIEDLGIKVFAGASIKEFKDNKPVF
ncbi:MAG: xanthine phosphoribosyltransferase [Bacilli bacterium]|nr:xanthine phosphoribosyltransferase [Bacilli bacterium]